MMVRPNLTSRLCRASQGVFISNNTRTLLREAEQTLQHQRDEISRLFRLISDIRNQTLTLANKASNYE